MDEATNLQRAYYARTAGRYDEMHVSSDESGGHDLAVCVLTGLIDHHRCESVLDVGSGTGRVLLKLRETRPTVRVVGVEPVAELRQVGYRKGLTAADLTDGDATRLTYPDGAFDVVCGFGVLHHISRPDRAVAEMLRVARRMVFISDSNNFGQGGRVARFVKQAVRAAGLWPVVNFLKTRGRGYHVSEGDGVAYSYSVFQNYPAIRKACRVVHLMNTEATASADLYRGAPHLLVAGIKR